jgi:hypothetical protein
MIHTPLVVSQVGANPAGGSPGGINRPMRTSDQRTLNVIDFMYNSAANGGCASASTDNKVSG